uniref:Uncharacterized protein n=1 Tax=Cacopsylla melanoneura TaxID=428564 RepID=A0A8D9BXR0_9HEMI
MYGKVVALLVIMAAVALPSPLPEPKPVAQPAPNPVYYNQYGTYVPTNSDYLNPSSRYYNPYGANPYAGYSRLIQVKYSAIPNIPVNKTGFKSYVTYVSIKGW